MKGHLATGGGDAGRVDMMNGAAEAIAPLGHLSGGGRGREHSCNVEARAFSRAKAAAAADAREGERFSGDVGSGARLCVAGFSLR